MAKYDSLMQEADLSRWYKTPVPRKEMKELMRRTNARGLFQLAGYLTLLGATGYLAYQAIGTVWMIPAYLVYANLYAMSTALHHETHHGTPFRSRWINATVSWVVGLMVLRESLFDRWQHTGHHTFTEFEEKDPEIFTARPPFGPWIMPVAAFVYYGNLPATVAHALGIETKVMQQHVPEEDRGRVMWSARAFLLVLASIVGLSIYLRSWVPFMFTIAATSLGTFLPMLYSLTQHVGMKINTFDHRESTRTIYLNPFLRFLYWNMNYHVEHHMYPTVPFHALPKLHGLIKHDLPKVHPGMLSALAEGIPAWGRVQKDPEAYVRVTLPNHPAPKKTAAAAVAMATTEEAVS